MLPRGKDWPPLRLAAAQQPFPPLRRERAMGSHGARPKPCLGAAPPRHALPPHRASPPPSRSPKVCGAGWSAPARSRAPRLRPRSQLSPEPAHEPRLRSQPKAAPCTQRCRYCRHCRCRYCPRLQRPWSRPLVKTPPREIWHSSRLEGLQPTRPAVARWQRAPLEVAHGARRSVGLRGRPIPRQEALGLSLQA